MIPENNTWKLFVGYSGISKEVQGRDYDLREIDT
jgi:hypothetical protein